MNPGNCPTCGQVWPPKTGRICSICELPINRHDRWHFVGSRVQHRDCTDPDLSKLTAANRAAREAQPELT
jgi:predicted amidophosphoribosyltransferase